MVAAVARMAQHAEAVGSGPLSTEREQTTASLDAEVRAIAAAVRRAALGAKDAPGEALRAGVTALLDALALDVERTWWWLAVWPAAHPALARRRRAVDERLAGALEAVGLAPDAARRAVADGWNLVHEHLWVEREPDLRALREPLLALVALRASGPGAVRSALAGRRAA
jgi:hypothetical protein